MAFSKKTIVYDYSMLKGKITEVLGSQKDLAAKTGLTVQTITNKLKGYSYFNQFEIELISRVLGIASSEYRVYFFTQVVAK